MTTLPSVDPKSSGCDCIARVNADLKEKAPNTRITTNLFGRPKCLVTTNQIKTGRGMKKAALLMASYCPFCGVAYEPSVTETIE